MSDEDKKPGNDEEGRSDVNEQLETNDAAADEAPKKKRGVVGWLVGSFAAVAGWAGYQVYVRPPKALFNLATNNWSEKTTKGKITSALVGPTLAATYAVAAVGVTADAAWNTVADIHFETSQHQGTLISSSEPRYCVGPFRVAEIQISTENFGREMSGDDPDIIGNTLYASITASDILARFDAPVEDGTGGGDLYDYTGQVRVETNETLFTERAWWNPCGRNHRFEVTDIRKVDGAANTNGVAPAILQQRQP